MENAACFLQSVDLTRRLLEKNADARNITKLPVATPSMSELEKEEIRSICEMLNKYKPFETALESTEKILKENEEDFAFWKNANAIVEKKPEDLLKSNLHKYNWLISDQPMMWL